MPVRGMAQVTHTYLPLPDAALSGIAASAISCSARGWCCSCPVQARGRSARGGNRVLGHLLLARRVAPPQLTRYCSASIRSNSATGTGRENT